MSKMKMLSGTVFSFVLVSTSMYGHHQLVCTANAQNQESSLGVALYDKADWVFRNVGTTHYKHNRRPARDQLNSLDGSVEMDADCSGFVSYVLHTVAHDQFKIIRDMQPARPYPQAKSFAVFFSALNCSKAEDGWIGVRDVSQLKKGDLIAWEKPLQPGQKGNTGHVMIVVNSPGPIECDGQWRFVSIEVLDSSSVTHFPSERLPPLARQTTRDGVGKGRVRIVLDENNRPVGYWEGTYWGEEDKPITRPTMTGIIGFGRLVEQ